MFVWMSLNFWREKATGSVCKMKKMMSRGKVPMPGLEPGYPAWKASMITTYITSDADVTEQMLCHDRFLQLHKHYSNITPFMTLTIIFTISNNITVTIMRHYDEDANSTHSYLLALLPEKTLRKFCFYVTKSVITFNTFPKATFHTQIAFESFYFHYTMSRSS